MMREHASLPTTLTAQQRQFKTQHLLYSLLGLVRLLIQRHKHCETIRHNMTTDAQLMVQRSHLVTGCL